MITKETITQRLIGCTPRELQQVLDIIRGMQQVLDTLRGCKDTKQIETVQEIIDLLAQPGNIREAEKVELETGEDYFYVVFNI